MDSEDVMAEPARIQPLPITELPNDRFDSDVSEDGGEWGDSKIQHEGPLSPSEDGDNHSEDDAGFQRPSIRMIIPDDAAEEYEDEISDSRSEATSPPHGGAWGDNLQNRWDVDHWILRFKSQERMTTEELRSLHQQISDTAFGKKWAKQFCAGKGLQFLAKLVGIMCVPLMPPSARTAMTHLCYISPERERKERSSWKEGSLVQVHFSRFGWIDATIKTIYVDSEGEWMVCRSVKRKHEKECTRNDRETIRPKPLDGSIEDTRSLEEKLTHYFEDLTTLAEMQTLGISVMKLILENEKTKNYILTTPNLIYFATMCLLPGHHPDTDPEEVENLIRKTADFLARVAWGSKEGQEAVTEALRDIHPLFLTALSTQARLESIWEEKGERILPAAQQQKKKKAPRTTLILQNRRRALQEGAEISMLVTTYEILEFLEERKKKLKGGKSSKKAPLINDPVGEVLFPPDNNFGAVLVGHLLYAKEIETVVDIVNLINACVASHQDLKSRLELRAKLLSLDIVKILADIRFCLHNPELDESASDNKKIAKDLNDISSQLKRNKDSIIRTPITILRQRYETHMDLFINMLNSDNASTRIHDVVLSDPDSIFQHIKEEAEFRGFAGHLMAMLQQLLLVNSKVHGKAREMWNLVVAGTKTVHDEIERLSNTLLDQHGMQKYILEYWSKDTTQDSESTVREEVETAAENKIKANEGKEVKEGEANEKKQSEAEQEQLGTEGKLPETEGKQNEKDGNRPEIGEYKSLIAKLQESAFKPIPIGPRGDEKAIEYNLTGENILRTVQGRADPDLSSTKDSKERELANEQLRSENARLLAEIEIMKMEMTFSTPGIEPKIKEDAAKTEAIEEKTKKAESEKAEEKKDPKALELPEKDEPEKKEEEKLDEPAASPTSPKPEETPAEPPPVSPPPPPPPSIPAPPTFGEIPPPPLGGIPAPPGIPPSPGIPAPPGVPPPPGGIPTPPGVPAPPGVPQPPMFGLFRLSTTREVDKKRRKPKTRMRRFHWENLKGKGSKASYWNNVDESSIEVNFEEFEELFGVVKKKKKKKKKKKGKKDSSKNKAEVNILESRRAYNISIVLARQRASYDQIKEALLQLDMKFLTPERVSQLTSICPTPEELDLIKGYIDTGGDAQRLGMAEKFFHCVGAIPRLRTRLEIIAFRQAFIPQLHHMEVSINIIELAIRQVNSSSALRESFATILALGNYMNSGTSKGNCRGFSLRALERLSLSKTNDNKTTLLGYIAKYAHEKKSSILELNKQVSYVAESTKIDFSKIAHELEQVKRSLKKTKDEMNQLSKKGFVFRIFSRSKEVKDDFVSKTSPFYTHAKKQLERLRKKYETTTQIYKGMLVSFEENSTEMLNDPATFFGVLHKYIESFKVESEKYLKLKKDAERRALQANKKKRKPKGHKKEKKPSLSKSMASVIAEMKQSRSNSRVATPVKTKSKTRLSRVKSSYSGASSSPGSPEQGGPEDAQVLFRKQRTLPRLSLATQGDAKTSASQSKTLALPPVD
eukprot:CAMPEP_0114497672 /NCGR_PEP_ID=MMETSP0109-20121206/6458_1 /TAXON_ID=29199 /ORGANISM="Chlorarachnion reptans, Strain CCCM449" /LENGTH=1511 /DNA_ID=CAMNT_0001675087 /DNA_START=1 /DNA_END=4536 /DNA_ORIENTATION=+